MARQGTGVSGVFAKIRLSTPRILFYCSISESQLTERISRNHSMSTKRYAYAFPLTRTDSQKALPRTSHRYLVLCSKCIVIRIFKQTSTKVQCFPAKISFVQGEIDWHDFLQCNIGVMPIIKCVMFRRLNLPGSTRKGPTDNETVFFLVTCITRLPWAICEYH